MKPAPLPIHEHERLRELLSLEILDTGYESQFDEIVQLASHICEAPITLVSLVDESRQWFKAKVGLDITESSRDVAFCSHTLLEDDLLVVDDLRNDERFRENPFVTGDAKIAFYAGSPLRTSNGYNIGTLCVLDTRKRQLTQTQRTALQLLSRQVVKELELRKANRELQRKNQMLQGFLENIPVIAYRVDGEGIIRELAGSGLTLLGFGNKQWVGRNAHELLPHMAEAIREVLDTGKRTFVSSGSRAGQEWHLEHYVFPDETTPGGVAGFALNVTSRVAFERELKTAKETAERATQAKSRFLANMSHEIRTPLNAILGFAQMLRQQPLPGAAQEYLDHISTSGELLLQLIGDVLDLTKIEEGKFELREERYALREVVRLSLHPYQFRAGEKGLQFTLYFADDLPEYVVGDANKLSQVVVNLVSNALKFTRQGGIEVRCTAEPPASGETARLKIAVRDTGIGIAADKRDQIFGRFTQADASISRQFGGSGLGLAIVKEVVERMGGILGVESSDANGRPTGETGSTFWFVLPLREADAPLSPPETGQGLADMHYSNQVHVLLVDDNEINQRLAVAMLRSTGCRVTVAGNGQEAIQKLRTTDFQLVLMDIQMPVLDGYQATRWIREKLGLTLPIVGLSANVYQEEIDQCYQAGMNDYLGKPYTEIGLREKLARWVTPPRATSAADARGSAWKLTNLSLLKELFDGDEGLVQDLVADFLRQQQALMVQMEAALAAGNYGQLVGLSHHMRSSIEAVGLEALREPLLALEAMAKDGRAAGEVEETFGKIKLINQWAAEELRAGTEKQLE